MAAHIRDLFSLRRHQIVSMDPNHSEEDLFLTTITTHLNSLLSNHNTTTISLLTIPFISKLLDFLLSSDEHFRAILSSYEPVVSRPPLDRLFADLIDRTVKSLDICNSISMSLHSLHHWNRQAAAAAASSGHLSRCRRALDKLIAPVPHRSSGGSSDGSRGIRRHVRALPSIFYRILAGTASASPLTPPAGEAIGLVVYTMSYLMVFCMWVMVVALRCGEGVPNVLEAPARQMAWAGAMVELQERIVEESRRGEKGVLGEVVEVEVGARGLMEVVGDFDMVVEVGEMAGKLEEACRKLEEGLGPLEKQVREVFHRLVGSRAELLRFLPVQ